MNDARIDDFRKLNAEGKLPWAERSKKVEAAFPSVVQLDWKRLFDADPSVMGRLVGDIIKIDQAVPGRPGKRAAVEQGVAETRLRQLTGQDYTTETFDHALKTLMGKRSIRAVALRLGISHTMVRRFLAGTAQPTGDLLERAALVFKKQPEYFPEYRSAYILGILALKLDTNPDATVKMYRFLRRSLEEAG